MSMRDEENDYSDKNHQSFQLLQQELRHMRDTYKGLKLAVDDVLEDHETRIRGLQDQIVEINNQKYLILGGGAVVGWLGNVLLRIFLK